MRWTMFAVLVAAFALVGAGCGGGDDESAADTDTVITDTITDETTTDETTTEETETDTDTGSSFDFGDEDCQALLGAYLAFSQALGTPSGDVDLSEQAEAFQSFAERVPDDIQEDVETLAAAYQEYAEALADIDLEAGAVPSAEQLQQLQDAASALGPEVTAASERLGAWTETNCAG